MRKQRYCALLAAVLLASPAAYAWEFLFPFGISIPSSTFTADSAEDLLNVACTTSTLNRATGVLTRTLDADRRSLTLHAVDLDWQFMWVEENTGITLKAVWDIGVGWSTDIMEDAVVGMQTSLDACVGWTPVRLDKFYLTVTGLIGFDLQFYGASYSYSVSRNTDYGDYRIRSNEVRQSWVFADFHVGFDAFAYIRVGDIFGIYGGCMFRQPVGVSGSYSLKQKQKWGCAYAVDARNTNDSQSAQTLKGSFTVVPAFGVCMFF